MSDDYDFLEDWYASQCDGEWEREYGVRISNVTNPGWSLSIDLIGTELEGRVVEIAPIDDDRNWLYVHSDGRTFEALSSSPGLRRTVEAFRRFARGDIGTVREPSSTLGIDVSPPGKPMPEIRF